MGDNVPGWIETACLDQSCRTGAAGLSDGNFLYGISHEHGDISQCMAMKKGKMP